MTNRVTCDKITFANATMAQLVERILGKDEVIGSIPISSSKGKVALCGFSFCVLYLVGKGKRACQGGARDMVSRILICSFFVFLLNIFIKWCKMYSLKIKPVLEVLLKGGKAVSQVTQNPFKYSDTNKRYHTYDYFLRKAFGEKCAKITLDAGFTCPNIDGTVGVGGCIYCSGGSASLNCRELASLSEQYERGRSMISSKWSEVKKFIPYLQAYTNTHTSVDNLKKILDEVASLDGAVMVNIATRADCLENEKIDAINELSAQVAVTVELGLQSASDKTAERINRCHTLAQFEDAICRLRARAPMVKIAVHIINGLPGEDEAQMIETARTVAKIHPDIIKIHLLHIIKGTPLAEIYERGEYTPLTMEQYVNIVCDQLSLLPADIVVERLTGDGERETLVAPLWSLKKTIVINEIDKEMYKRDTYQGKNYKREN